MEQQENLPQKSGFNKIVTDIYSFVKKRRAATVITAVAVALCITVTAVYYSANNDATDNVSSLTSETVSKYQPADVSTESEEPAKPSEVSETVSEVPKQNTVSSSKPQSSRPFFLSPLRSSDLMGVPVNTAFSLGRSLRVSGKLQHIFTAEGALSLLARPGVMSDS